MFKNLATEALEDSKIKAKTFFNRERVLSFTISPLAIVEASGMGPKSYLDTTVGKINNFADLVIVATNIFSPNLSQVNRVFVFSLLRFRNFRHIIPKF